MIYLSKISSAIFGVDECQVSPVVHVLQYAGCIPKPIPSFACIGRCSSYLQVNLTKLKVIIHPEEGKSYSKRSMIYASGPYRNFTFSCCLDHLGKLIHEFSTYGMLWGAMTRIIVQIYPQ